MRTIYKTSFEEGSYDYEGHGELTVPMGWEPAWLNVGKRPEYDMKDKQMGQPEVLTGRFAANFFTVHSIHKAALMKKFIVIPGSLFVATVYGMGYTIGAAHGMHLVADPNGGVVWEGSHVIEGEWWSTYMVEKAGGDIDVDYNNIWKPLRVAGRAGDFGEVTVFLQANADHPGDIMASHWDLFELLGEESGPPVEGADVFIARMREHANSINQDCAAFEASLTTS